MALPDKFSNIQPLTPGQNAKVFKATNNFLGREVFVKIYPIPVDDEFSALREPQLLQAVKHDNLTEIFAADTIEETAIFLEMEFVAGGSFQDLINTTVNDGWPSVHTCIKLILDVGSGLSHLHTKGYVHRDVKPANLLIRKNAGRQVGVVTDLGLASKLNDAGRAFSTKHARLYRPPEVWSGKGYSVASDIYQLRIVLYQMLAGFLDYELGNLDDEELSDLIINGQLIDMAGIGPHVGEPIRKVLNKCICPERDRYKTMSEFLIALNNAKLNQMDWSYTINENGFTLRRTDGGFVYKVDVESDNKEHTISRSRRRINGQFRAKGQPEIVSHGNIGSCRKFRNLIEW